METITSRKNPFAVHLKKLGSSGEYRLGHKQFLCDGAKLLEEAINSGTEVAAVMTVSPIPFPLPPETHVYLAPQSLLDSLSPLKNAQDVLFLCKMPEIAEFECTRGTHILLDRLQDPGNLGTILRTADAFGIDSVILTAGCADPFNPKTIRATMGAVFKQRILSTSVTRLAELVEDGLRLVGASPGEDSLDVSEVSLNNAVIAIGSEGRGLSDEVLSLCSERVRIPISETCESLNASVAAAILMWEATKR